MMLGAFYGGPRASRLPWEANDMGAEERLTDASSYASSESRGNAWTSSALVERAGAELRVHSEEGAVAPLSSWTFRALLHPISTATFCAEQWGRRALHLRRNAPEFYSKLICLEDIEQYLGRDEVLNRGHVRMRRREFGPFEHPSSLSAIHAGLRQGKSLQLRKLESVLEPNAPLLILLRDMELAIQHPKESLSCYITPPNGEGLGPHLDESEIFTLQISGAKRWRLFDRVHATEARLYDRGALGPPRHEFRLEAGDLLYHPRGYIHEVTSEATPSFSVTIVFTPLTWKVLLDAIAARLTGELFEEQLPAGTLLAEGAARALRSGFEARMAVLWRELEGLQAEAVVEHLRRVGVTRMSPVYRGHIEDLFRTGTLTVETLLERRHQVGAHVARAELGALSVICPGLDPLVVPERAAAAVEFALRASAVFRVAELPGLSSEEQVAVAQWLAGHGLLRFATPLAAPKGAVHGDI
jgi:hypothetical protein